MDVAYESKRKTNGLGRHQAPYGACACGAFDFSSGRDTALFQWLASCCSAFCSNAHCRCGDGSVLACAVEKTS